ncbi:MAG: quinolinate synthase [Myxococcota bacterium]|jgi:quinolinate synthase
MRSPSPECKRGRPVRTTKMLSVAQIIALTLQLGVEFGHNLRTPPLEFEPDKRDACVPFDGRAIPVELPWKSIDATRTVPAAKHPFKARDLAARQVEELVSKEDAIVADARGAIDKGVKLSWQASFPRGAKRSGNKPFVWDAQGEGTTELAHVGVLDLRFRVSRQDPIPDVGDLLRIGLVGLVDRDDVRDVELGPELRREVGVVGLECAGVEDNNRWAKLSISLDCGVASEVLSHLGDLRNAACLHDDPREDTFLHKGPGGLEVAFCAVAPARGGDLADGCTARLDHAAVKAILGVLADDDADLCAGRSFDEVADGGGLAGAKDAGHDLDDGHRLLDGQGVMRQLPRMKVTSIWACLHRSAGGDCDTVRRRVRWVPAKPGDARMVANGKRRVVDLDKSMKSSGIVLTPGMPICQTDLPLDWYQDEFKPYAEEYLALPDRTPETVLPWMDRYIVPALDHFGDKLMLLAHYYMGGEIVKLVERYGGMIADSYTLALQAVRNPTATVFVESAVHFMAETIALLKNEHQDVWITNPKSGCTMEALAKEAMVLPVFEELEARYGDDLLAVCYMNTSGRLKALAGRTNGAVCTSSNAAVIMTWARKQKKKIVFIPDRHLGENSGRKVGIPRDKMYVWPGGWEGQKRRIANLSAQELSALDESELILWGSYCSVHTVFQPRHVEYWKNEGYRVLVHPESTHEVVSIADGHGSTSYLWDEVMNAPKGSKIAIGTEGHFVRNALDQAVRRGVEVVNLADVPDPRFPSMGCGCATMSRNDPPHLVAMLDLLRKGEAPELNRVLAGDAVDEVTGWRERLDPASRNGIARDARKALETMIELTEAAK